MPTRPAKAVKPDMVDLRYMGMQELTIPRSTWEVWGVTNQDDVTWSEENGYMAEITVEAATEIARYRHTEFEASVFGQIPDRLRMALQGAPEPPVIDNQEEQ